MFHFAASIETALGDEEVPSLMAGLIGEGEARPFLGSADGQGFTIEQIKAYRTSFLPRITGRYVTMAGGVSLSLSLRPHREVIVFLLLWASFLALVSAMIIAFALPDRPARLALLGLPAVLGLLTYTLSIRVFRNDCRWTLRILKEHLPSPPPAGSMN